ncbi:YciI family protein [Chrysiogenes arsenatis]|uniref:YciI family protein n=1 Tax=Chrysiogenes arsenatis TaxID=309797 RepID=UPI00042910F3|nr:YciI family protein [Chrysiogenes arsenatis]
MIAVYAKDKADALSIRLATRPDHVAYLTKLHEAGEIAFAGPLQDDAGETMIGSLLVFTSDDLGAVRAMLDADPYTKAGLFETVEVRRVKRVF